jgi:YbgC/YbaW family acyl-CoA thioester hydrolase
MTYDYRHRRRIEFADTDNAGIVHFARFLCFAEEAEHAFLRSLGLKVHVEGDGFAVGFPRLAVRCEYLRPARFEEEIEVHIWVRRKGRRSLTYQFQMRRDEDLLAQGEVVAVCSRVWPDGRVEGQALPAAFSAKIEEAPFPPLAFREGAAGGAGGA